MLLPDPKSVASHNCCDTLSNPFPRLIQPRKPLLHVRPQQRIRTIQVPLLPKNNPLSARAPSPHPPAYPAPASAVSSPPPLSHSPATAPPAERSPSRFLPAGSACAHFCSNARRSSCSGRGSSINGEIASSTPTNAFGFSIPAPAASFIPASVIVAGSIFPARRARRHRRRKLTPESPQVPPSDTPPAATHPPPPPRCSASGVPQQRQPLVKSPPHPSKCPSFTIPAACMPSAASPGTPATTHTH